MFQKSNVIKISKKDMLLPPHSLLSPLCRNENLFSPEAGEKANGRKGGTPQMRPLTDLPQWNSGGQRGPLTWSMGSGGHKRHPKISKRKKG